jgi:membrane-associated protease RseP (regulator of RpoE activity)
MKLPLLLVVLAATALALPAAEPPKPNPPTPPPPAATTAGKPFLGVQIDENNTIFEPEQGLPVTAVVPGCTAANIGVLANDRIKSINGQPLKTMADLQRAIGELKLGGTVTIELVRKGDKGKEEKKTVSGPVREKLSPKTIGDEMARTREEIMKLKMAAEDKQKKELSLADILKQLQELEEKLPAAVAEFKKLYPNGEFNFTVKIEITSDKNAKQVIEVGNQPSADVKPPVAPTPEPAPAPAPAPAPKP